MRYYENPPVTGLVVPANDSKAFTIPYPTRVRLTVLRVLQTNGTPVDFSVDLYSKEVPDTPSAGNADDLWLVTQRGVTVSDAAGIMVYEFPDADKFFFNHDDPVYVQAQGQDSPSLVSTSAQRKIYARITNSGGNEGTFSLILGSESSIT